MKFSGMNPMSPPGGGTLLVLRIIRGHAGEVVAGVQPIEHHLNLFARIRVCLTGLGARRGLRRCSADDDLRQVTGGTMKLNSALCSLKYCAISPSVDCDLGT